MIGYLHQVAMTALLLCLTTPGLAAAAGNQCVSCHSDPARLIPAIREMLDSTMRMPGSSSLSEGEG